MATPAPSQFATLLRRSKFASFDPHIGQVYTAYGGHSARGNFGLKRPLALRRRNAHITVQAVDSREQQTVWRSAEQENRWVRMWDELGLTPSRHNKSSWTDRVGVQGVEVHYHVDSEFAPGTGGKGAGRSGTAGIEEPRSSATPKVDATSGMEEPRSSAIPNVDAMSQPEFERYLTHLRRLRPAFHSYIAATSGATSSTLFKLSHRSGDIFQGFLESQAYEQYHKPLPRFIEQQPHRFAGLSYSHASKIQTLYTTKPHRGRVIAQEKNNRESHAIVGLAGMTPKFMPGDGDGDFSQVATFRFIQASLIHAPATVGARPEGLEHAHFVTSVRIDSDAPGAYTMPNPHAPGSREYVGQVTVDTSMTNPIPKSKEVAANFVAQTNGAATMLLQSLSQITP